MKTRRSFALLASTALLALGGAAGAAAQGSPAQGGSDDARSAKRCERLDHAISALERASSHLEKRIARVQAKIAGGELSPEQKARAEVRLGRLEKRLARRAALTDRLEAKLAEKCA